MIILFKAISYSNMDFVSRFLGIAELNSLKEKQLIAQSSADSNLALVAKDCPDEVLSLLLNIRKISRIDQQRVIQSNL